MSDSETEDFYALPEFRKKDLLDAITQVAQLVISYAGVLLIGRTPQGSPAYSASGFALDLGNRPVRSKPGETRNERGMRQSPLSEVAQIRHQYFDL
jgi:hypothetical protein